MKSIAVICEGPTEREFVLNVLQPAFAATTHWTPTTVGLGRGQGGTVKAAVLLDLARNLLKNPAYRFVTTLVDLYGCPSGWPGWEKPGTLPSPQRADAICNALSEKIGDARFVPYLQMHEFEALLFTDLSVVETVTGRRGLEGLLTTTVPPEEVNHDQPPGARIKGVCGGYSKMVQGVEIAQRIGVPAMRGVCPRFNAWLLSLGL